MQTNTNVVLFPETFPAAFNRAAFAGKTNVTEAITVIVSCTVSADMSTRRLK